MNFKSIILSGAAAVAIVGGSAAFAQSGDYPRYGGGPAESSPQELQQTDELNQQSINGTEQSPAALNGEQGYSQTEYAAPPQYQNQGDEGGTYSQGRDYESGQPQYNAPPAGRYGDPQQSYSETQYGGPQSQYDAQQQQYQQQMQQYQGARQRYQYDRSRYAQDVRAYDLAQYEWSYPAPLAYHYADDYDLRPLYLIAEPSTQLWRAPVEGPGGRWVGRVRNVEIAPDGRPQRIEIALNRRVSVWVRPGDLRFDPEDHVLYTDLSRGQLWMMPGATIESSPL